MQPNNPREPRRNLTRRAEHATRETRQPPHRVRAVLVTVERES